jgi:hypothetical protein
MTAISNQLLTILPHTGRDDEEQVGREFFQQKCATIGTYELSLHGMHW